MKFLEALIKSNHSAATAQSAAPAPTSPPAATPPSALTDMLALLSARKAEAEKEKGEAGDGEEVVFCKICGLKETREKLIDHIYVHLIGKGNLDLSDIMPFF